MKTILIVVQSGFMARYILRSGVLENLKKLHRIVILTPNSDEKYFVKEFKDKNVLIEPLRWEDYERYEKERLITSLIKRIKWYCLPFSSTPRLRRKFLLKSALRSKKPQNILTALVISILSFLLERFKLIRLLFLKAECRFFCPSCHKDIFAKYAPSALIVSSLGYLLFDHFIMREAKRAGVPIIATPLSWDNTTAKGLRGADADSIIIWTENMKNELIKHHDQDDKKIFVGGVPHFDIYFNRPRPSRKRFVKRYSLHPARKVILYATRSPNKYPWNGLIIKKLIEAIRQGRFVRPTQLLVRVHPLHYHFRQGTQRYEKVLDQYKQIEKENHHLVRFVYPEILSRRLKCDMPFSEMKRLKEMLCFSDVMLCNFSTMMIEASIFALPFINIAIFGHNKEIGLKNFAEQFVHLKRMNDAGKSAYSFEELIDGINDYLLHPEKDADARRLVVEAECGPFRGNAAQKFAEIIEAQIK